MNIAVAQSGSQVHVIVDGTHYRKTKNADEVHDLAVEARENPTEENIQALLKLLEPQKEALEEGRIEKDEMGHYLIPGTSTPVPKPMAEYMEKLKEKDISTKTEENFWKNALMNPSSQTRNDMFEYCQRYGITITRSGMMVLYKAVNRNKKSKIDPHLVDFVGENYLTIKRNSDKPSDYIVLEDSDSKLHLVRKDLKDTVSIVEDFPEEEVDPEEDKFGDVLDFAIEQDIVTKYRVRPPEHNHIVRIPSESQSDFEVREDKLRKGHVHNKAFGRVRNLVTDFLERGVYINHGTVESLYASASVSESGQFEPSHHGKGYDYGQNIRLGEPVSMPREKCDPSIHSSCSKGLHVGSYDYVSRFGRTRDVILATLVNPRDIVALPRADQSKLRTCLYYPYAIMRRDENKNWSEISEVEIDEDYIDRESDMDEMLETLKSKDDLTNSEEDRKKIIQDRLKSIH